MKLFGNKKYPAAIKPVADADGPLPSFPAPEAMVEFDLSDKEFENTLKLLLDDEDLETPAQLEAEAPKEMGKPVNTDYHIATSPIRGTKVVFDDEDEEKTGGMAGWLKGTLLLLSSVVIFVLVTYGVYVNLV